MTKKLYNTAMEHLQSFSHEDTFSIAFNLSKKLKGGEILLLSGDLGAGKTVFSKGIAKGLGINEEITSPTFILMNEYQGEKFIMYHIDAYNLSSGDEAEFAGITEHFGDSDSITIIEWWTNINTVIPKTKIINIEIQLKGNDTREIIIYDK